MTNMTDDKRPNGLTVGIQERANRLKRCYRKVK
jgi:hypothetical protein